MDTAPKERRLTPALVHVSYKGDIRLSTSRSCLLGALQQFGNLTNLVRHQLFACCPRHPLLHLPILPSASGLLNDKVDIILLFAVGKTSFSSHAKICPTLSFVANNGPDSISLHPANISLTYPSEPYAFIVGSHL
jgi:hypothetical protein